MGQDHRLVLADVKKDAVQAQAAGLRADGYDVAAALACDVSNPADVPALAAAASQAGPLGALIHTAGLSPAFADWEPIVRVNLVGTARILEAFLEQAGHGSVAICIASLAADLGERDPRVEALLDAPLAPDVIAKLEPFVMAAAQASGMSPRYPAYAISKRGVIRMVEDQVRHWAGNGARIVSISPGLIATPMGLQEAQTDGPAALVRMTPAGRWGTAVDIANAVRFLCSGASSFITGCDLRVDGGVAPLVTGRNAAAI
ncbi:MAG: SDR family oxidoreductase [Gammaproteobacteria bacterium]